MKNQGTIRIGEWRLDPPVRALSRGDVEHRLEPKMVEVLLILVENAGRPVPREHLERAVWSGAAVGTEILSRTVWKLRRILGDDAGSPSYIETIPRVGYRLIAPVGVDEGSAAGPDPALAPAVPAPAASPRLWAATGPSRLLALAGALSITAAAAALGISARDRAGAPPPGAAASSDAWTPAHIAPLTSTPSYEADPSVSPDGRLVAFQRWDKTLERPTWDVLVLELATGRTTELAASPEVDEYGPVWSPAGDSVAYVRQGRGCDLRIQAPGGEPVSVAPCAADQGHEVAWDGTGALLLASSASGQTLGLLRIDRATGRREPVTSPPVGFDGDRRPRPSPDGSRVAFVRQRTGGVSDLWLLDRSAGGTPLRLTSDHRRIGGLAWTPDGRWIVFSSTRRGTSRLWRLPAEGGAPPVPVPMSGRNVSRLSFGGPVMVYEEYMGDADLWTFDPGSGTLAPWGGSSSSEWAVTVSPDGRAVAYLSDRTGSAELWVQDASGDAEPLRLTRLDGARVDPPQWSPDGSRLLFAAALEGTFDLYAVPAGGGALERLTDDPGDERAPVAWAGGIVYTANRTGMDELWALEEEGSARRLTTGGAGPARPSPDGRTLWFTRPAEPGLWRLDRGEARPRLVRTDVHPADWGNWTPAADGILYLRAYGGTSPTLERLDTEGPAVRRLARVGGEVPDQAGVALLPDGRILFARVVRSESDLWIARREDRGAGRTPDA